MEIKCYNKKCLHEFNYTGKKKENSATITCPKCRYKLRLGKAKIKSEIPEIPLPHSLPHDLPHEVTSLPNPTSSSEISEIPSLEIIEHKNICDFNLAVLEDQLIQNKFSPLKIKILSHPLPKQIKNKFEELKELEKNPFFNAQKELPSFSIRQIPFSF